ncbi:MAG: putative hemolysin [Candidatus Pseudothioglobus sp.]|jgi:putative hemolysin
MTDVLAAAQSNIQADRGRSISSMAPVTAGHYEVRLARSPEEIQLAQALRYRVMYAEKGGKPDLHKMKAKADIDEWDARAHHIIVIDRRSTSTLVVGTLRLTSNFTLTPGQTFYTEQAFDLTALRQHYCYLLELGRFCIDPAGRNGLILMLIWKFAMTFIVTQGVDVMLGCASFPGTDITVHRPVLSYLYQNNLAPEALMPKPIVEHVSIRNIALDQVDFDNATRNIPTLLKGYLKLGARVSDSAIIDEVFNTSFLCIYVDAAAMMAENTPLVSTKKTALNQRKPQDSAGSGAISC